MKQARSLVLPVAALVVIPGILVWAALFFVINTVYSTIGLCTCVRLTHYVVWR